MRKIKVLINNEFSKLGSGFATYMNDILSIIHADGRFEIAELGSYLSPIHPLINSVDWKVYPNEPHPADEAAMKQYHSDQQNQLGKFKFDETVLDFQPDIVVDIRDPWYSMHVKDSPYRDNYKFIHMATVDGFPLKAEFFDLFKNADMMMTYSEWGKNVLEYQSAGTIKVFDVAPPPVDINVFKVGQRPTAREDLGIDKDLFVLGTTMRNQPRKLFPELLKAFALYLQICEQNGRMDLVSNSYMYWHTTNPDMGWDIPTELRVHNLSHKVLFTYICDACSHVEARLWSGERCFCNKCRQDTARLPNPSMGVSREMVSKITSVSNLYIQYATNGGWEMGINEAKACGVPALIVPYSAMAEQCYNGGGISLRVLCLPQEPITNTNQLRAMPDNAYTAQAIYDYATSSNEYRTAKEQEARKCVEQLYSPSVIAQKWINAFLTLDLPDQRTTWKKPLKLIQPNLQIPEGIDNRGFMYWMYAKVIQRPNLINTTQFEKLVAMLDNGYEPGQSDKNTPIKIPVDRQKMLHHFIRQMQEFNAKEKLRFETVCRPADAKKKITTYHV